MTKVVLDQESAEAILNYLGSRPYIEVAQLIALLVEGRVKDESASANGATESRPAAAQKG